MSQPEKIIVGIDPGSRLLGYGVVSWSPSRITHLDHGVLSLQKQPDFSSKLLFLSNELEKLFLKFNPHFVSVEKIFVGKNVDSAFKLGHVRGVCLMNAAKVGAQSFEYAPRSVKKKVTGHGAADKEHVRLIVCNSLGIRTDASFDATDALALALAHCKEIEIYNRLSAQGLSK